MRYTVKGPKLVKLVTLSKCGSLPNGVIAFRNRAMPQASGLNVALQLLKSQWLVPAERNKLPFLDCMPSESMQM